MLTDDAWTGPVDGLPSPGVTDETPMIGALRGDDGLPLLRGIIRASSAAIVGCDDGELIVAWSAGAERLFGYGKAEVIGRPWMMLLSEDARASGLDQLGLDVLAGEPSGRVEVTAVHRDRSAMPVSIDGRPVRRGGEVLGISWAFRDVAGRRRVQRVAQIGTFVIDVGDDGSLQTVEASAGVAAIMGLSLDEVRSLTVEKFLDIVAEADRAAVIGEWRQAAEGTLEVESSGDFDIELRLRTSPTRGDRWVRISAEVYRGAQGRPWRGLGAIRNVTAERRSEELLSYESTHDRLTRLPNRALLLRRLQAVLDAGAPAVVLSIDLDRFGVINELYGTLAGDQLMVAVGERLRAAFATDDPRFVGPTRIEGVALPLASSGDLQTSIPDASPLARSAGDSFVVVSVDPDDVANPIGAAGRVQALFEDPYLVDGEELWLTACVGTASGGGEDTDSEVVAARADQALHQAKRRGTVWALTYESLGRGDGSAVPAQIGALRQALSAGHLRLAYQPSVDLVTGRVTGVEALARWPRPDSAGGCAGPLDGPMVAGPSVFVPLAEEAGMVVALDDLVLALAGQQLSAWQRALGALPAGFTAAVNVSGRHLIGDRLLRSVHDLLLATGIDPGSLVLEVTETALMEDVTLAAATIRQLRELGVGIAIDDFGTGYSSLAYLETLSVDVLKLDGSFVARLDQARNRAIVAAVVHLADALDFRVIAEGIETAEQADQLIDLGCRYGQGYHFARPGEPNAITGMLQSLVGEPG